MAVEQFGQEYKCKICGNEVRVTKVGGGTLVCCGKEMKEIEEKTQSTVHLPDTGG